MKTQNSILMREARTTLSGKWGLAIGTILVYYCITIAVQSIPKAGPLLGLLIGGPMILGLSIFTLRLSRNEHPKFDNLFEGWKHIGVALSAYLLITLFTILWTLLLIIPGIIAALSYSMTFFILADDASIGAREAINKSKRMMDGNKWKLFCLGLRFIGWALLCILTLGIGFLWLTPYMQVSTAKFYDDVKGGSSTEATA